MFLEKLEGKITDSLWAPGRLRVGIDIWLRKRSKSVLLWNVAEKRKTVWLNPFELSRGEVRCVALAPSLLTKGSGARKNKHCWWNSERTAAQLKNNNSLFSVAFLRGIWRCYEILTGQRPSVSIDTGDRYSLLFSETRRLTDLKWVELLEFGTSFQTKLKSIL